MIDEHVYDLFQAALRLAPDEWESFLQGSCSNRGLRALVDELLRQDHQANVEGFLNTSCPGKTPTSGVKPAANAMDLLLGQRVGPYQIQQLLARGGMGSVYLAVRIDDYHQRVAIKLLDFGWDFEERVRRFQDEREILATLSDPHIARLLDGGTTGDNVPYLVMEYIEGHPIDEYCRRCQASTRHRLELLLQVCQAVHHAHQRLVLHRDLKPGNLLVDGQGQAKVLDFGVARVLDGSKNRPPTEAGSHPGTRQYMSPEQLAGDPHLDVRSDVYALGLIAYEVLTGQLPYDCRACSLREAQRVVNDQRIAPPSRLVSSLRGDVDTILLKALATQKDDRYPSAADLAADLQRHLDHRPILARRGHAGERLWKWSRRNPLAACGASLAVVTGAALLTVSSLWTIESNRRLTIESKRAEDQAQFQRHERRSLGRLLRLHSLIADVVKSSRDDRLRLQVSELYRHAIDAGDENEEHGRHPILLVDRVSAQVNLANMCQFQGRYSEAKRLYEEASGELERLAALKDPPISIPRTVAAIQTGLGNVLLHQQQLDQAAERFQRAVDIRRKLSAEREAGPDSHRELAQACFNLGLALDRLGMMRSDAGLTLRAKQAYHEATELAQFLVAKHASPEDRSLLGQVLCELGALCGSQASGTRDPEPRAQFLREAHDSLQQALRVQQALASEFPKQPDHVLARAQSERALGRIFLYLEDNPADAAIRWLGPAFDGLTEYASVMPHHEEARNLLAGTRREWLQAATAAFERRLGAGDYSATAQQLDSIASRLPLDDPLQYSLGYSFAMLAGKVLQDKHLGGVERSELLEACVRKGLAALHSASSSGQLTDRQRQALQDDEVFAAFSTSPAFQALLTPPASLGG